MFLRALKQRTIFSQWKYLSTKSASDAWKVQVLECSQRVPKICIYQAANKMITCSEIIKHDDCKCKHIYGGPPTFLLPETAIFSRKELLYRNFPSAHIFFAAPYLGLCMGKKYIYIYMWQGASRCQLLSHVILRQQHFNIYILLEMLVLAHLHQPVLTLPPPT